MADRYIHQLQGNYIYTLRCYQGNKKQRCYCVVCVASLCLHCLDDLETKALCEKQQRDCRSVRITNCFIRTAVKIVVRRKMENLVSGRALGSEVASEGRCCSQVSSSSTPNSPFLLSGYSAGLTTEGSWIRIVVVPFRRLPLVAGQDYRVTATVPEYDLLLAICQRRLRYLGHILCMPESRVV